MENLPKRATTDKEKLEVAKRLDVELKPRFDSEELKWYYADALEEEEPPPELEEPTGDDEYPPIDELVPPVPPTPKVIEEMARLMIRDVYTPIDLAKKYKDDGNFFYKHKYYYTAIIITRRFSDDAAAAGSTALQSTLDNGGCNVTETSGATNFMRYDAGVRTAGADPLLEASFYNNRAACFWELKNYRSCLFDCERALSLNRAHDRALIRAIRAALKVNKPDTAVTHCLTFQSLYPKNDQFSLLYNIAKTDNIVKHLLKWFKSPGNKQEKCPIIRPDGVRFDDKNVERKFIKKIKNILHWPIEIIYNELNLTDSLPECSEVEPLKSLFPPRWDVRNDYKPENINLYFKDIDGKEHKADLNLKLKDILRLRYFVRLVAPTFYVFVKDSPAENFFLNVKTDLSSIKKTIPKMPTSNDEKVELAKKLDVALKPSIDNLEIRLMRCYDEDAVDDEDSGDLTDECLEKLALQEIQLSPPPEDLVHLIYDPKIFFATALAMKYKEDGNFYFSNQFYHLAIILYTEGIKIKCGYRLLDASFYNNIAACHWKLQNYRACLIANEKALSFDEDNRKARFRAINSALKAYKPDIALKHCWACEKKYPDSLELIFLFASATVHSVNMKTLIEMKRRMKKAPQIPYVSPIIRQRADPFFNLRTEYKNIKVINNRLHWTIDVIFYKYSVLPVKLTPSINSTVECCEDAPLANQLKKILPPWWDEKKENRIRNVNVYFKGSDGKAHRINPRLILRDIMMMKHFVLRCGSLRFYIVVKGSIPEEMIRIHGPVGYGGLEEKLEHLKFNTEEIDVVT